MKIAIYCPNCGKLIDDIDKYKGDVECGYYNNDRDKYEIKCKYCTNVIKLYKIEFNCMLCEHRNEAFIMEDYQPRRFLIHLISSECKNKKCKFFKDKREKVDGKRLLQEDLQEKRKRSFTTPSRLFRRTFTEFSSDISV